MKLYPVRLLTSLARLLFTICIAPVMAYTPDPHIRFLGRFDLEHHHAPAFSWPGSAIRVRFTGTSISVNFATTMDEDYFEVIVDGARQQPIRLHADQTVYRIAEKLNPGEHVLELVQRTEADATPVFFQGITLDDDGTLLPLPPRSERRIEFYGDSVTSGNSNEGLNTSQPMGREISNSYLAYGAITARQLNAESVCIAASGRKLYPDFTIPAVYDRVLGPSDEGPKWIFSSWIPQVVVINLGSNDEVRGQLPHPELWIQAYKDFIAQLRYHYPDCHVMCCLCSSLLGKDRLVMQSATKTVVDDLRQAGDSKIHYVEFAPQAEPGGIGPGWHPTVKTHQLMADQLALEIKCLLGW